MPERHDVARRWRPLAVTGARRALALRPYVSRLARSWPGERRHLTVDGALVSLDLRGFTNLTRRFSARGRSGAEEVTAVISECFAQLVDAVEDRGGDVVAFGGDALLALFDGHAALDRAAAAAITLRDGVRGHSAVPTSLGTVPLSARIAIGVGQIHCYRIGQRQQAVVVAGPVVSRTLEHERHARARDIVADRALFESATSYRRGAARGGGFVLIRAAGTATQVARAVERDNATIYVAPALRPWLQAGVGAGEHRDIAVAFVFAHGLDRLAGREGHAAVLDALLRLATAVEGACERNTISWVNTDAQRDGVKLTLVAGLPAVGDHDPARLVRGVHELLAELPDLSVGAGATACRAFVGDIGSPSRRGLMVMGDGVNLAARLAARARPHWLLGDQTLVTRVPDGHHVALTPFTAKGFVERVQPYRIDDNTAAGSNLVLAPKLRPPTRLHGRRRERDALLHALDAARHGSGSVVEIIGDAGAGKSRLLGELIDECKPREGLVITGDPTSARVPFAALRHALRERLGRRPSRDRDLRGLFEPAVAGAPAMTERAQRQLHEALLVALGSAPLVLVVDDAQWLDDASRGLVSAIAAATGRPWLVCVSRRTGSTGIAIPATVAVRRLRLRALSAGALRAIARDAAVAPIMSAQLDRIIDAAQGNPLFASQLAASGSTIDQVPERIERVIAARIDALDPSSRARLREAAVLGREIPLDFLAAVTGDPLLARAGAWSRLPGLVVVTSTSLRFEHELVRQVAYDGLSFARRRTLHRAAMDSLLASARSPGSAGDLASPIAVHAEAAGCVEITWEWSRRAAAIAASDGAFDEAVAQYERALRAARSLKTPSRDALASTLEALGDAADRAGEPARAAVAYRRARRTINDPQAAALIASKLGLLAERQGRYVAAARWFRTGLLQVAGATTNGSPAQRDRAHARLLLDFGSLRQYEGRYDDAVDLAREARALAGKRRARQLVAESELQLEMAFGAVGNPASEDHFDRAERALLALGDDENLATLYINGGLSAYESGDWHRAEERYARALVALEHGGHPGARATVRNNQAMLLIDRGSYENASALLEDARRDWLALGFEYGVAVTTMSAGRIAAFTGDARTASSCFREARRNMARLGTSAYDAELAVYDVERLIADHRYEAASRVMRPARALLAGGDRPALAVTLTRLYGAALAGRGRLEQANRMLRAALEEARRIDARVEIAYTVDALLALDPKDGRALRRERKALAKSLGIVRFPFRDT